MKDISAVLATNLRRLRKKKKLTQEKLAELSNLSQPMVQQLESGMRWAGPDTIRALASALKVPDSILLTDSEGSGAEQGSTDRHAFKLAVIREIAEPDNDGPHIDEIGRILGMDPQRFKA